MQSDLFIIINIPSNDNSIPSLVSRLGRSIVKESMLGVIAEYIYKEKQSIPISIRRNDYYHTYKNTLGGTDRRLIKSIIIPKLEDSMMGIDFIKLTEKSMEIEIDGLLSKNSFLLQISFSKTLK